MSNDEVLAVVKFFAAWCGLVSCIFLGAAISAALAEHHNEDGKE